MADSSVRLDLRAVLAVGGLAVVVLVIIFVELCGREDVEPLAQSTPVALPTATIGPSATPGPTFTPGPSPTAAPEEATATGEAASGSEGRDVIRVRDLAAIREALEEYREENESFPDSGGNVQTLCTFADFDAGCELEEVLSPLPQDPLGDPATNGYWYSSNGSKFTVWARREAEQFPECTDHPAHLESFDSLFCVRGP